MDEIKCYYGPGQEYTKEQHEIVGQAVVIVCNKVKEVVERIAEMVNNFVKSLNEYFEESKPIYYSDPVILKNQVMNRKPKFVRIRNNC